MKDNLRTSDRESQDPELLPTFQHPIITHVRTQLKAWLYDRDTIHYLSNDLIISIIIVYSGTRISARLSL